MARRVRYCVGCGAIAPPRPTRHGWTATQKAGKGKGQRWYFHCGCLPSRAYIELTDRLFDAGLDLPRAVVRAAKAAEEGGGGE